MSSSKPFAVPSPFPAPQAVSSTTFTPPPLDGSVLVSDMFAHQAKHSPEHPLFVFQNGAQGLRTIRYSESYKAIQKASAIVRGHYLRALPQYTAQGGLRPADQPPTVGILASADTVSYATLMVGIMRLGLAVFPISTRNSPAGVAHLLRQAHVVQLFVSPDPAMQTLATETLALLHQSDEPHRVELLPMLQFQDVYDRPASEDVRDADDVKVGPLELDSTTCIFHSSGSTSFPKPIRISNRSFLQWSIIPWFGELDISSVVFGVQPLPMFHALSSITFLWTVSTGCIVGCYKPSSPPTVPTPENYLEAIHQSKSTLLFCAPSFVEAWAQDPESLASLKGLSHIVYGGGPLSKQAGDQIAKMGIAVFPMYGATECGSFSMFLPAGVPAVDEWQFFKLNPELEVEMLPQEEADDIFEMTAVEGTYLMPNAFNATSKDGRRAYRTNDLLQRHPRDPTRWRVIGRADDQIMLSTGEKTNPGPLENILVGDRYVKCAVMFGRGRLQNGVIVEPWPEYAFDPTDERKLVEFRNAIWPTVEKMNEFAPAHSRLFKEMILVASPNKPFEYTPKGSAKRRVILNLYDEEIKAVYAAVEDSSQAGLTPPSDWTHDATLLFVAAVVRQVMERELKADDDLFQNGCDSLQATWIRNTLVRALRESKASSKTLPNSVVYNNPTIALLAKFIHGLFSTNGAQTADEVKEAKVKEMTDMLAKYTSDFPVHKPVPGVRDAPLDEVVLLTGSTGRLGCHILSQLLSRPSVKKVYGINRGSSAPGDLAKRQKDAFTKWKLNGGLLADAVRAGRVVLLEADLAKESFGLPTDVYEEMKNTITGILHNAWLVNFNVSLASFEPLVAGIRHLVDLSLTSPRPTAPPIIFTSSISVLLNSPPGPAPEVPVSSPYTAIGMGYAESKWVAESILLRAPLRSTVVRVGQMCGDSQEGGWTEKEWLPVLVRGSQALGALPQRDEELSWIPVDGAASVLLDFLTATEHEPVLHLVHPTPVAWGTVVSHFSKELELPLVSAEEWLARLSAADAKDADAAKANPAVRLLDFFTNAWSAQAAAPTVLSTDRAERVSPALRGVARKPLGESDVRAWVRFWRDGGFLKGLHDLVADSGVSAEV